MSIKLKICGIRDNPEDIIPLEPDYMGFIFYENSPRFIGEAPIPFQLNKTKTIGVFVNEEVEKVIELAGKFKLDYVQLHGDETPAYCKLIKQKNIEVIKVFRIGKSFNFDETHAFRDCSVFYLFDTQTKHYGGSGKVFDWSILKGYDQHKPFFLGGGLDEEALKNLEELEGMNLHALDLNSGVESSPGMKDPKKIKNFVEKFKAKSHEVFGG